MNQETKQENPPQEYILIVGEIVFRHKEQPEMVNAVRANGVMISDNGILGVYAMGKAQQVLQANFFKKIGTPDVEVVDVVLMNFVKLGRMTVNEFQCMPEGLKFQERVEPKEEQKLPVGDALDQAVAAAGGAANG